MTKLSKTQIDRLGDRLRSGSISPPDLKLLDEYRLSFGEAYETVVEAIRDRLQLESTGRPAKSTTSIMEKLRRESIRLSQVQDIAGCRIVVTNVMEQDRIVSSLQSLFPGASVIDRRINPSFGYRAVHVVPRFAGKLIEVQVRSSLQHLWSELSEKCADVYNPALKYGQGEKEILERLGVTSKTILAIEKAEELSLKLQDHVSEENLRRIRRIQSKVVDLKAKMAEMLRDFSSSLQARKS